MQREFTFSELKKAPNGVYKIDGYPSRFLVVRNRNAKTKSILWILGEDIEIADKRSWGKYKFVPCDNCKIYFASKIIPTSVGFYT